LGVDNATLPYPIRTAARVRMTDYFRTRFQFPADPRGTKLRLRLILDDGCVLYLNGGKAFSLRMPEGPVNFNTPSTENITVHTYEGPFELPATNLVRGENVLAVEVHQQNATSSDVLFGLTLEASIPAVTGDLVINEVAALNGGSVTNGADTPDWIELFNGGAQTLDLGGLSLSDDMLAPTRFVFPANTRIEPRGYLVVWCDDRTNAPGLHTGFGLDANGQTVALFSPGAAGLAVRDYVTFGLQARDLTISRERDGSGGWVLSQPTPGAPNLPQPLATPASLKINEWMASSSGDDWLELHNPESQPILLSGLFLTDDFGNPTNTRIAELSFIAPRGFAVFRADQDVARGAHHVGFKLSAAGEQIGLYATNGVTRIDGVTFGPQAADTSEGRLPDGAAEMVAFPGNPTPGASNLRMAPRFTSVELRGTALVMGFVAEAGRSYTAECRDELGAGAWRKLADVPAEAATRGVEITDALPAGGAQRFYRLVSPAR
jgi:hypothetical protein